MQTANKFGNDISPEIINDPSISESSDTRVIFRENSFRYYHEKNKILVIYLSVKKLRQLMKSTDFVHHTSTIYLLMMVLAKKGAELSELTILSLAKKNNIFKLDQFELYCQGSPEYNETLEQLQNDQQIVKDYKNYVFNLKDGVKLSPEEMQTFNMCNQHFIELRLLDDTAKMLYQRLRSMGEPAALKHDQPSLHIYLLSMIFTIYSIKSEIHMPYKSENIKFDWDTFIQKHEELSCEYLNQFLIKLES